MHRAGLALDPSEAPTTSGGATAPVTASRDPAVSLTDVSQWFIGRDGQANVALTNVTMEVPDKQFVAIVGASGCGKTTLLNLVAGLVRPEAGNIEIRVGGEVVTPPSTQIGYMWARDALFPWRSLRHNVEFGLEVAGMAREQRRLRAQEMIEFVGLAGAEKRYPGQLSQGMRQRANLARLLAVEPNLFLMDEPFSALDAQTKAKLQNQFSEIWEDRRTTVVYVTHDLSEAALLADRVVMMHRARIVHDIPVPFERPRDLEALRFDPEFQDFARSLWSSLAELDHQSHRNGAGR